MGTPEVGHPSSLTIGRATQPTHVARNAVDPPGLTPITEAQGTDLLVSNSLDT